MQRTTNAFDIASVRFDLEGIDRSSASDEFPTTIAIAKRSPANAPCSYAIPTTCLSLRTPRGRLTDWRLFATVAESDRLTPDHIIGAVVLVPKGRTSAITGIDPAARRIRTESGSIYELGDPDNDFGQQSPEVMRYMGF